MTLSEFYHATTTTELRYCERPEAPHETPAVKLNPLWQLDQQLRALTTPDKEEDCHALYGHPGSA